jgi:hypothetical protein
LQKTPQSFSSIEMGPRGIQFNLRRWTKSLHRQKTATTVFRGVTGEKFIRSDFDDTAFEMNSVRKVTDHNAIDDVILKEGSPVQFPDNGKWLTLAGSN